MSWLALAELSVADPLADPLDTVDDALLVPLITVTPVVVSEV